MAPRQTVRVAFVGFRGIPARYGGFETLVEHVAPALAARGHMVGVYCRKRYNSEGLTHYRGVHLYTFPAVQQKYWETPSHTFSCLPHLLSTPWDVVILLNSINAPFAYPLKVQGKRVYINVDGLEKQRKKWNIIGKWAYAMAERLSITLSSGIIADAKTIQRYYLKRYGAKSIYIPYGGDMEPPNSMDAVVRFGLKPKEYYLYVARFEPENYPDKVLEAFSTLPYPLCMVGDNPYNKTFVHKLKAMATPNVIFTGAQYGKAYRELLFHARGYVAGFSVGGTHPALVEAMGAGLPVCTHRTPENEEVGDDAVAYWNIHDPNSLRRVIKHWEKHREEALHLGQKARMRVERHYTWQRVIDGYNHLIVNGIC